MNVTATVSHALGHWPRILPALGIQVLKNRHQPCPVCGGSDRFRFDDREPDALHRPQRRRVTPAGDYSLPGTDSPAGARPAA
ncbi:primase-helicase zinc-binding domain-containing protein [Escherichia coli]|nr:primase-helicase zinc-binding domain-containing protein [Escherichia coli]MCW9817645.1 hypothetical protein [Escherichia coli]MCW9822328.1 hypothetical protein [Escherichia coli]MDY9017247.1 primase-helicase zinc-binding domain-containing protein [Escherichia coli]MDZ8790747.1 primase-helicase zinc-binding domain-containing protein [Escherichia coli]MDZ9232778.1 primase-helicase zinc-binding domain-containing protein [Escherichia coli]